MSATDVGAPGPASSDRAAQAARFKDLTQLRQADLSDNDGEVVASGVESSGDTAAVQTPPDGSTPVI